MQESLIQNLLREIKPTFNYLTVILKIKSWLPLVPIFFLKIRPKSKKCQWRINLKRPFCKNLQVPAPCQVFLSILAVLVSSWSKNCNGNGTGHNNNYVSSWFFITVDFTVALKILRSLMSLRLGLVSPKKKFLFIFVIWFV